MGIDITAKSNELKEFVSQFNTKFFLGDISNLMQYIRFENRLSSLEGLSSPQRQLMYLAGLNVTSKIPENKELQLRYSPDDLIHMKKLLIEIEEGYNQFFYPKQDEEVTEEWIIKRRISMPVFLSYFNQGLLNYEEQIIERIQEFFSPFNIEIENHLGLSVSELLDIYNFIDAIPNNFLMEKINKKKDEKSEAEFIEIIKNNNINPSNWNKHLPKHLTNLFSFMDDKGSMLRFKKQLLIDHFGNEKTENFLNIFTIIREEGDFLYYTESNPLNVQPIFKITEDEFQAIEMNTIIQSIYNTLFSFCTSDGNLRERFYALRGRKLEDKIQKVFERFLKNQSFVYKGFYTQDGHEQDLLLLDKDLALSIEAKASKRDEPRREPDKAYPVILYNFMESIQKGYDQTYRVKSKFINKEVLKIYSDQELKNHLIDIRTKNYTNAFSIIVTLERFGQIQTDLSDLLEIYDDDTYPWSICIDDLESFLLTLEKIGRKKSDLVQFLKLREKLHGRLFCGDELELCGAFIEGLLKPEEVNKEENTFITKPDYVAIFDEFYMKKGLGFEKEKNLELKTSGKYLPIGGY